MAAGAKPDDPSTPVDGGSDEFFSAAPDRDEADFWSEADGAKPAPRARRHRPATKPRGLHQRLAAAWAAESSARRVLRGRPDAATTETRRKRRLVAGIVGGVALLAVALAVGESVVNDGTTSDRAGAEETTLRTGTGTDAGSASSTGSNGSPTSDDYVESAVVDAPSTKRPGKPATRPKATTTTTTAAATDAGGPSAGASGGASPAPPKPAPPAPNAPVPTTAAPAPTAPPPTPTTTAPRPAAPAVQAFKAQPASSAGGVCPPLQWATTFTWSTSNASSVTITGLLESTLSGLPGAGSRVVCRLLPAAPLGGWTLTATGPGGTATATAP